MSDDGEVFDHEVFDHEVFDNVLLLVIWANFLRLVLLRLFFLGFSITVDAGFSSGSGSTSIDDKRFPIIILVL
jgi:hypothetical protein